ncbi:MAG: choice-of-anchor Q domain-containing protein, partial [Planctomycetota bacterium]
TTGNGGAIVHSYGRLTLENVQLVGNSSSGSGGAIWATNTNPTVEIHNSQLSGNIAVSVGNQRSGGAIYQGSGLMVIRDSTLSGNTAYGDGGAIFARNATLVTATRTSIDANEALGSGGDGGAIYSDSARIRLYESSVTNNYSRDDAAIELRAGSGIVRNTTISGNRVFDDAGGLLIGSGAQVEILHSTITRNTADAAGANVGAGGGLFALSNSSVTVDHSIIADNVSRVGPDDVADSQTLATTHSLIGVDLRNAIIDNGGNLIGTTGSPIDPLLGPLLTGPTGTKFHGPLPGSPAIHGGDPAFASSLEVDQRSGSFDRVFGAAIDIGSIEIQPQNLLVDTLVDELDGDFSTGDLSLREALLLAAGPEDDVVTFDPALNGQTLVLTMGELPITGSVTIFAVGAELKIDAQGNSRVFDISDGDAAAASDVTLRGLTLTGGDTPFVFGSSPNEDGHGGAIRSYENLTISDSVITQNEADIAGGGLFAGGIGSLTVERTEIRSNQTTQTVPATRGSGAAIQTTGSVTFIESTIESNRTELNNPNSSGGGLSIQAHNNIVQIERSSIADNEVGGSGGGLHVEGSGYGQVVVSRSTISGNEAVNPFSSGGGVLASLLESVELKNCN